MPLLGLQAGLTHYSYRVEALADQVATEVNTVWNTRINMSASLTTGLNFSFSQFYAYRFCVPLLLLLLQLYHNWIYLYGTYIKS